MTKPAMVRGAAQYHARSRRLVFARYRFLLLRPSAPLLFCSSAPLLLCSSALLLFCSSALPLTSEPEGEARALPTETSYWAATRRRSDPPHPRHPRLWQSASAAETARWSRD